MQHLNARPASINRIYERSTRVPCPSKAKVGSKSLAHFSARFLEAGFRSLVKINSNPILDFTVFYV